MGLNPYKRDFTPKKGVVLPNLAWTESPNKSSRRGTIPWLIVIHRPVGKYGPSINWLTNGRSQASAHVITEGNFTGVDVATQLVPWDVKSWSCADFNSMSYNIEADDNAWDNSADWGAFYTAAHIAAFICHKTGIPPVYCKSPLTKPGIVRHLDLGKAGGGHSDPTTNMTLWNNFIKQVAHDVKNTKFRDRWGHGKFLKETK